MDTANANTRLAEMRRRITDALQSQPLTGESLEQAVTVMGDMPELRILMYLTLGYMCADHTVVVYGGYQPTVDARTQVFLLTERLSTHARALT